MSSTTHTVSITARFRDIKAANKFINDALKDAGLKQDNLLSNALASEGISVHLSTDVEHNPLEVIETIATTDTRSEIGKEIVRYIKAYERAGGRA